jgi:hypothetical protein
LLDLPVDLFVFLDSPFIVQRAEALARCKLVATSGIRMREQVVAIDVGADQVVALSLDPFKAYLTTVDGDGTVRVTDYGSSNVLNRFPVNAPGAHLDNASCRTLLVVFNTPHSLRCRACRREVCPRQNDLPAQRDAQRSSYHVL